MTALDEVERRLREVTGEGRNGQWRCPAHDDRNPSLHVEQGEKGVVLTCHANCSRDDILNALGLKWKDLFDAPKANGNGLEIAATYDYRDEQDALLFQVVRFTPKTFRQRRPDGNGGWTWGLGDTRRVLYRLPQILAAKADCTIYVVEGERDVEALEAVGEVATCNPMGAGKWRPEYEDALAGAVVCIVADNDVEGRKHARSVAWQLEISRRCRKVVRARCPQHNDIADHLAAGLTVDDLVWLEDDEPPDDDEPEDELPPAALGSWEPVDLAATVAGLVAGTLAIPTPTICARDDGKALFYAGRVNGLYGPSGDGKTWVANLTARDELHAGRIVWWIDFEDDEIGTVDRMLDLSTDPSALVDRFRYIRPEVRLSFDEQANLLERLDEERPAVIVIDSTGEWMGQEGIDTDRDHQVSKWIQTYIRSLTRAGSGVVLIDHVPHDHKDLLRPIGSQRKKAAITGSAFMVIALAELGRGRVGKLRLTTAKDRRGNWVRGKPAAEMLLDATTAPYGVELTVPTSSEGADGDLPDEKPAVSRVRRALELDEEPATVSQLGDRIAHDGETRTGLKKRTIQDALKRLEALQIAERASKTPTGAELWIITPPKGVEHVL